MIELDKIYCEPCHYEKEKQALKNLLKNIFQKNAQRIEIFRNFAAKTIRHEREDSDNRESCSSVVQHRQGRIVQPTGDLSDRRCERHVHISAV